ncbi:MAG: (d)CMP kinase [Armatimonadota bacterium]
MKRPIIAIDGPAGAGKSSVAKAVAEKLNYIYVDTGAMYRAIAWKILETNTSISDIGKVSCLVNNIKLKFEKINNEQKIFVDNIDVTQAIRTPEVTRLSSPVSAIQAVRKRLTEIQRSFGSDGGIVMEGRDIGTVIFPDAELKIFLTASAEERAKRRTEQLKAMGQFADVNQIEAEIRERDLLDSSRQNAPLIQAKDAILIDTDRLTEEEVVQKIIELHNKIINKNDI